MKDTALTGPTFLGLPTLGLCRRKCSDCSHWGVRFSGKASQQGLLDSAVSAGIGRAGASHDIWKSRCQNPNHTSLSRLPKALFTQWGFWQRFQANHLLIVLHSFCRNALRSSYWIYITLCSYCYRTFWWPVFKLLLCVRTGGRWHVKKKDTNNNTVRN